MIKRAFTHPGRRNRESFMIENNPSYRKTYFAYTIVFVLFPKKEVVTSR